jgi:hypothetical protein
MLVTRANVFPVYAVVALPTAICRLGVWSGWRPPFDMFVISGLCVASSGLKLCLLRFHRITH